MWDLVSVERSLPVNRLLRSPVKRLSYFGSVDGELKINQFVSIPLSEIEIKASRSSGPGGQHANVTASRIEAIFVVADSQSLADHHRAAILRKLGSVVRAIAQDNRSQTRNRELALQRLSEKLERAIRVERKRVKTKPSKAAKRKRLDAKKQNAQRKQQRRRPSNED